MEALQNKWVYDGNFKWRMGIQICCGNISHINVQNIDTMETSKMYMMYVYFQLNLMKQLKYVINVH